MVEPSAARMFTHNRIQDRPPPAPSPNMKKSRAMADWWPVWKLFFTYHCQVKTDVFALADMVLKLIVLSSGQKPEMSAAKR